MQRSATRVDESSTCESSGTSRSSKRRPRQPAMAAASRRTSGRGVAASNSVARSVAARRRTARRIARAGPPRSGPPSGSASSALGRDLRRGAVPAGSARARGETRACARPARNRAAAVLRASNVARAATASDPRYVAGASPSAASTGPASRSASCVRLNRCRPIVAPAATRIARARSSTARASRADEPDVARARVLAHEGTRLVEPELGGGRFDQTDGHYSLLRGRRAGSS